MNLTKIFALPLLALCVLTQAGRAQTETGSISGTVLDASGGHISGAVVNAESISTGAKRSVTTSSDGVYALTALPLGHYKITVSSPGFQVYTWEDVQLQVGQSRTLDAQMQLASVGTSVTVQEATPDLAQTSAEISGVVSGLQVRELPLNGRNWASLMTQTPGAVDSGGASGSQRSIRFVGRGLDDNNFRFDGVDATGILNQAQKGTFRLQFSTEAIAEFRARAALFTAENGGTEGGQVDLVSRSGANDFHGSAFEYLRNDFFDARGPFDPSQLPPFRLNQFGGSFGGPIRKDKDFFFATYEGLRQRVGQTLIGFVPSARFRAQVAATTPGLNPVIAAYPLGTSATSNLNVDRNQLHSPATFITYGDMRFTDPANKTATNPRIRKWLVDQIVREAPDAVLLNGDVPLAGDVVNDYQVYRTETQTWRDHHLHVYPALGNHEFHGPDPQRCLENWWNAFPELRQRRWYSAQIGSRLYSIALDSDASLLPDSDQARWLTRQLQDLPSSVDFVVLSLHHPPVADIQTHIEVDHNPRPNEIALRDLLSKLAPQMHAQMLVSAGHIHNYERNELNGVIYLVSGGGGAKPYFVERTPNDLYQSALFPNYHYVKFVLQGDRLHATMYRIADPEASSLQVQAKDEFDVPVKPRTSASR